MRFRKTASWIRQVGMVRCEHFVEPTTAGYLTSGSRQLACFGIRPTLYQLSYKRATTL
jgi:hypothetical protein